MRATSKLQVYNYYRKTQTYSKIACTRQIHFENDGKSLRFYTKFNKNTSQTVNRWR